MKPWDTFINKSTNQFGQQPSYALTEQERQRIDKNIANRVKEKEELRYQVNESRKRGVSPFIRVPAGPPQQA